MSFGRFSLLLIVAATCLAEAACSEADPVTGAPEVAAPGSKSLTSDDPTCSKNADCATGEQCVEGVCQMDRCGSQPYQSAAPLGRRSYFAVDRELVVLDDGTSALDGYEPTGGSFAHPQDLRITFGGQRIVDEAGGNFTGRRPEGVVAALAGKSSLSIAQGETRVEIPVGFVPIAVAAGDVDGDGTDEVVALSPTGEVAVCTVADKKCTKRSPGSITPKDLTMADVDADGREEPVVLGDRGGSSLVIVMNFDDATSGQPAVREIDTKHVAIRITAGDIEPGGAAEIITLEDGGYAGFATDTLRVIGLKDDKLTEIGSSGVAKDAIDIFAGDTDGDDKAEIIVLEKSGVEVFDVASPLAITSAYKTTLSSSTTPTRLAMADLDGDSPAGTLVGEAELVAGPVVPVSVIAYPPYSRTRSSGTANISVGNSEYKGESQSTTVTLSASVGIGFEAEIPGIAKVGLNTKIHGSLSRSRGNGRSITIGDKFSVDARPDLEGPDNGVAVLSCACYHAYTYNIEDPAGRLGDRAANDKKLSLFVPVGGQTALWSLKRYNALADRLGTLPVVRVPYKVGDPKSYPSRMQTLAGKPIPEADLLFTTPRAYRTSDVANVGWSLSVGEDESQSKAATIGVSIGASVKAGPVALSADVGVSTGASYTVSVGRDASFSGSVPPVRNDVRTPEDESKLYGYGFSPIVYRDRYKTKDGREGGLFVVTYSVTP